MYYILSILIIGAAVFFAAAHFILSGKINSPTEDKKVKNKKEKKSTKSAKNESAEKNIKLAKTAKYCCGAFSAFGFLFAVSVEIILNVRLGKLPLTAEYISWARDMFHGYVRFGCLFFLIISALYLLSFFTDKKHSGLRVLLCVFSMTIVLIMGVLYSYIASNDTLALSAYIQYFSLGVAAAIIFPVSLDLRRSEKNLSDKEDPRPVKESVKENKKK